LQTAKRGANPKTDDQEFAVDALFASGCPASKHAALNPNESG